MGALPPFFFQADDSWMIMPHTDLTGFSLQVFHNIFRDLLHKMNTVFA